MPEVTAEDLQLLDTPVAYNPNTLDADEAKLLAPVTVENTDAPQSFWERRGGDIMNLGASSVRPVGSAMVFFGDGLLRGVPSPNGDIRRAPSYFERTLKALTPQLEPETKETIGKFFVKTGAGLQNVVDTFIEKNMKGREGEGRYDIPAMVTQGAGSIIGTLGLAVATRGALVPAAAITGGAFFETYDKAIRKGKNYDRAVELGTAMAITQGVPEFYGLHTFLNITGGAFRRFMLSGLTEALQEGTQQAGQEIVERPSGISDTQKQGIESVKEGLTDTLVASALGFALGAPASIGPALMNRRSAKEALKAQGLTDTQATQIVDRALERGVSGALEIVDQERQLMEKGIYRDVDGNPVIDTKEGPQILTQEEVVAKFTEVPRALSMPMVEEAQKVLDKVAPQKETVGVTEQEKALVEDQGTTSEPAISAPMMKALEVKFAKIEQKFKSPIAITKQRMKTVQKAMLDFVKSKELTPQDQKKFTAAILNTQTFQQLERVMPEIKERISSLRERQSQREEIQRFTELSQEKKLSKLDPTYQQAIRDLVKDVSATKVSVKEAMRLEKLAQFLEDHPDNMVPEYKIRELRRLDLKSLRDMSSADIKSINDVIGHLYKLAENKATLLYKGELKEFDAIRTDAVRRLERVSVSSALDGPVIEPQKFAGGQNIFGVMKDIATVTRTHADILAQELDTTDDGPFKNLVWRGLSDARTYQLRLEQAVEDYFVDNTKGLDLRSWSEYLNPGRKQVPTDKFKFVGPKGGVSIGLTKAQQIYFYLAMQNENSARHILEGGISFDKEVLRGRAYQVTEEQAATVMERVANDPDMMRVANLISEYLNGFQKDLLNNASLRLLGYSVAVEDNYVHIRVNPHMRTRMAEIAKKHSVSHALLEGLGLLKPRVKSSAPIYLDDIFASVQESSYYSIRYATYAEPLRAAKRILNDQEVRTTLETQGRGRYLKALEEHVERVEGELVVGNDVDKLFRRLNTNVQAAILRLNPRIALMQYTAHLSALAETELKYWAPSFRPVVGKTEFDEIRRWSPKIYDRTRGHTIREIGELVDMAAVRKIFTGQSAYEDWMLAGIRKADRAVLSGIWRAAKAEIRDKNPELTGEAFFRRVAERAEDVVRKTQAPYDVNDRSAMLGRKDFVSRTFSVFGSEIDALANIIHRAQLDWKQSNKGWEDLARYTKRLTAVYVLNGLAVAFLRLPFNILKESPDKGREDEEDKDAEVIVKRLILDIISGPIGLVFGVKEMAAYALAGLVGVKMNWDINQPLLSTASDIGQGLQKFFEGVNELIMGEEYSEEPKEKKKDWLDKVLKGMMDVGVNTAMLARIPAANVQRFLAPFFTEEE